MLGFDLHCLDNWTAAIWPLVVQLALDATIVLSAAVVACLALRRRSAALRHEIWTVAIVGLLALPVLRTVLPGVPLGRLIPVDRHSVEIPPIAQPGPSLAENFVPEPLDPVDFEHFGPEQPLESDAAGEMVLPKELPAEDAQAELTEVTIVEPSPIVLVEERPSFTDWLVQLMPWPVVLVGLWGVGVLWQLLIFAMAWLSTAWSLRRARPVDDPQWKSLLDEMSSRLGLRRPVAIVQSDRTTVPSTAGWLRPRIILPPDHGTWSDDIRRVVLAHELTHVARRDVLWQMTARAAGVFYWFHPLVHLASRRLRWERELACDDAVLRLGERPSSYARHLLSFAAALTGRSPLLSAAVAMASRRPIETRIRSVLHPTLSRAPLTLRTGCVLIATAALVLLSVGVIRAVDAPAVKDVDTVTVSETELGATESEEIAEKKDGKPKIRAHDNKTQSTVVQKADHSLLLTVLDEKDKPVAGAKITRQVWQVAGGSMELTRHRTDKKGQIRVNVPEQAPYDYALTIHSPGHVLYDAEWKQNPKPDPIPKAYIVRLAPGQTIGGVVHDEQGKPVKGVRVNPGFYMTTRPERPMELGSDHSARTDAEGRWTYTNLPMDMEQVRLTLRHPDYMVTREIEQVSTLAVAPDKLPGHVLVIKQGLPITGKVTDELGEPITGAEVRNHDDESYGELVPVVKTDKNGVYHINNARPGERLLTASAKGWAPWLVKTWVEPEMEPVNFKLSRGKPLQVRVVDDEGKPIAGAEIGLEWWRGSSILRLTKASWGRTGGDGTWTWNHAPKGALEFLLHKDGFKHIDRQPVQPGEKVNVVTMRREKTGHGQASTAGPAEPPDSSGLPILPIRNSPTNPRLVILKIGKRTTNKQLIERAPKIADLLIEAADAAYETGTITTNDYLSRLRLARDLKIKAAKLKGDKEAQWAALENYVEQTDRLSKRVDALYRHGIHGGEKMNLILAQFSHEVAKAEAFHFRGNRIPKREAWTAAVQLAEQLVPAAQKAYEKGIWSLGDYMNTLKFCRDAKLALLQATETQPSKEATLAILKQYAERAAGLRNRIEALHKAGAPGGEDVRYYCASMEDVMARAAVKRAQDGVIRNRLVETTMLKRCVNKDREYLATVRLAYEKGDTPLSTVYPALDNVATNRARLAELVGDKNVPPLKSSRLEPMGMRLDLLKRIAALNSAGARGGEVADYAYASAQYALARLDAIGVKKPAQVVTKKDIPIIAKTKSTPSSADPKLQAEGMKILAKMARANRQWLIDQHRGGGDYMPNYEYDFVAVGQKPRHVDVDYMSRRKVVDASPRQGILWNSALHYLARYGKGVVFDRIEEDDERITLDYHLEKPVKTVAGNCLVGMKGAPAAMPVSKGRLVLDRQTFVPLEHVAGGTREVISDYILAGSGQYLPRSIDIHRDGNHWRWSFAASPRPWLLRSSHSIDEKGQAKEELARVENVTVEGRPRTAREYGRMVLRAVDIDTGRPLAGVSFGRSNTGSEAWGNAIGTSDSEGYLRFDAIVRGQPPEFDWYYSVWKLPKGYKVAGMEEVKLVPTVNGPVEHTFKLRKRGTPKPPKHRPLTAEEFARVPEPKPQPKNYWFASTVDDMPGFEGKEVKFSFYPTSDKRITREQRELAAEIFRDGRFVAKAVRSELEYFQRAVPEDLGRIDEMNRIVIEISQLQKNSEKPRPWRFECRVPGGILRQGYLFNFKDLDEADLYVPDYRQ